MHEATRFIHEHGQELRGEYRACEELGKLSDRTVEILKQSGGLRLLLSKDVDGYEAHPRDFFEWVMAVGSYNPAAGWIAGVVGVHPYEFAMMNETVRNEVFGADPDTMVASPFAPFGRAKEVEGGYLLSGRWPYSTGTDHSDWVILGGLIVDDEVPDAVPHRGVANIRHFVIPKSAGYEIVEDSWNVLGLGGTGSKDVVMTDVFVPEYRTVIEIDMEKGVYADLYQPGVPLYQMGFFTIFPAAIIAGTYGIIQGLLREIKDYLGTRVSAVGTASKTDPVILTQLARADADVDASIRQFLGDVDDLYESTAAGEPPTLTQRIQFRRNQVAGTQRSVSAVNDLFRLTGSQAVARRHLLEGFFRDLQVAQAHGGNQASATLQAWALHAYGEEIPATVFV